MRRKKRGSSYIFVIVMVVFLVVLATGFYYMSSYNVISTVENRTDTQGELLSRSLHSTLCRKAADGNLSVINRLVKKGKEDYEAYLEELEAYREDDEEGEVPEEPDPESEYRADSGWTMVLLDNSFYEEAWMKSEVTCKPFKGTAVITTHVKYKVTDVDGKTSEYYYDLASDMTYGEQMEVVTKDPILVGGGEGGTPGYALKVGNGHFQLTSGGGTFEWGGGPGTEELHIIYGKDFTIPWGVTLKSSLYAGGNVTVSGPVGVITEENGDILIDCPGNIYSVGGDVAGDSNNWIAGDVYAKSGDGAGGNVRFTNGPDIYGGVYADGDIGNEIRRADCLWAGGNIRLGNAGVHSFQSVEAAGDIEAYNLIVQRELNSAVPDEQSGHVISRTGSISIVNQQSGCNVAGSVIAGQNITISGGSVTGDVISESGNIILDSCNVEGNVYGKNVTLKGTVTIGGAVAAGETVDISEWPTVTIAGDISAGSLKLRGNSISLKGTVLVAGDASMNGTIQLEQPVSIAGQLSFDGWASLVGAVEINARSITGQIPDKGPGITINEDPQLSVTLPELDIQLTETAPIPDCPVEAPADTTDQKADFSAFEEAECSLSGNGGFGGSPASLDIEAPVGKNVVYNLPDKYIKLDKVSVPENQIVYLNLDAMDGKTLFMPTSNGNKNKILGTLILYSTRNVTIKFNGSGKCTMNAQIYVPNGSVIVGNDNWQNLNLELTGTVTAGNVEIINGASLVMIPSPESFGNTGLGVGGGGGGGSTSYPFPSVGVVPSGGSGWGVTRLYRPETGQENAG